MATMILCDEVLRARHIEGDPDLARAIRALPPHEPIVLRIEGQPMRFHKVLDGRTGQPTDAISPDDSDSALWRRLQTRRGTMITVEPETPIADPYLLSLSTTLTEWNSPEDSAAYDEL